EVLKRLTRAAHEGDGGAGSAAVHVLWRVLRPNGREVKPSASPEPWILALLPEVLVTLPTASNDGYAWVELVEMMAESNAEAAIRLAVTAAASDDLSLAHQASNMLIRLGAQHPEQVMDLVGEALLDPSTGWRLDMHSLRNLVAALPASTVKKWCDVHGRPAVLALAHHLPAPYLDNNAIPTVPEITAYVLDRYGDDEQVCRQFFAGIHNGQ